MGVALRRRLGKIVAVCVAIGHFARQLVDDAMPTRRKAIIRLVHHRRLSNLLSMRRTLACLRSRNKCRRRALACLRSRNKRRRSLFRRKLSCLSSSLVPCNKPCLRNKRTRTDSMHVTYRGECFQYVKCWSFCFFMHLQRYQLHVHDARAYLCRCHGSARMPVRSSWLLFSFVSYFCI